jgi:hypothetical protein
MPVFVRSLLMQLGCVMSIFGCRCAALLHAVLCALAASAMRSGCASMYVLLAGQRELLCQVSFLRLLLRPGFISIVAVYALVLSCVADAVLLLAALSQTWLQP